MSSKWKKIFPWFSHLGQAAYTYNYTCSFNKYLLSTYHALGAGNWSWIKQDSLPSRNMWTRRNVYSLAQQLLFTDEEITAHYRRPQHHELVLPSTIFLTRSFSTSKLLRIFFPHLQCSCPTPLTKTFSLPSRLVKVSSRLHEALSMPSLGFPLPCLLLLQHLSQPALNFSEYTSVPSTQFWAPEGRDGLPFVTTFSAPALLEGVTFMEETPKPGTWGKCFIHTFTCNPHQSLWGGYYSDSKMRKQRLWEVQ